MKTWDELTEPQQQAVTHEARNELVMAIVKGTVRFLDELNGDDLQARIDRAIEKANLMRTPWFAGEYVYDAVQEEIDAMVRATVEEAYFLEPGERSFYVPGVVEEDAVDSQRHRHKTTA